MISLKNLPSWRGVKRSVADPTGILDPENPGNELEGALINPLRQLKNEIQQRFGVQIEKIELTFADFDEDK